MFHSAFENYHTEVTLLVSTWVTYNLSRSSYTYNESIINNFG